MLVRISMMTIFNFALLVGDLNSKNFTHFILLEHLPTHDLVQLTHFAYGVEVQDMGRALTKKIMVGSFGSVS